jgi:hypothetical protein
MKRLLDYEQTQSKGQNLSSDLATFLLFERVTSAINIQFQKAKMLQNYCFFAEGDF